MTTVTLTSSQPEVVFNLPEDGDVQVLLSDDSSFAGAIFRLEYETDTPSTYFPIPDTRTTEPYSRIYSFKSGNLKLSLAGNPDSGDGITEILVDIK